MPSPPPPPPPPPLDQRPLPPPLLPPMQVDGLARAAEAKAAREKAEEATAAATSLCWGALLLFP